MKHDELIRRIRKAAKRRGLEVTLERWEGDHEQWRVGTVLVSVPRHRDIGPKMEFEIYRDCEPVLGHRWWR
jgi:hypothetical protein